MTRKAERDLALIVSCVRGAIDPDHSLELGGKEVRDLDCCHALIYLYMPMSIYRSIYSSICLSIYLSIYLSVYLSICLPTYLSIYLSTFSPPVGTYHLYICRYK